LHGKEIIPQQGKFVKTRRFLRFSIFNVKQPASPNSPRASVDARRGEAGSPRGEAGGGQGGPYTSKSTERILEI